jgi:universal stress protein E
MERILVATDFSERSRRALRRGLSLARQFGSELMILHVTDSDRPERLVEEERRGAEMALCELVETEGGEDLPSAPSVMARTGDPFRVIVDEADALKADLVVMGAHRKRLLGEVFTGTTIERVMRLGRQPVLMVNRDGEVPYGNVLAAVDLSRASAHALRTARTLGLLDPAAAAAVHGFLPPGEALLYYAGFDRERVEEHVTASVGEARAALNTFLRDNGFGDLANVLLVEKVGPFEAIDSAVNKIHPDLLVIGTRGHGGLTRLLLGSVADQVLRQIDCDVLAVPPEGNHS